MAIQAATVVGIVGMLITYGLFLAPVPTFVTIRRQGSVANFSPNLYLAMFMNCFLGLFYGMPFVHPNNTQVMIINGPGCVIGAIYIVLYIVYANQNQRAYIYKAITFELVFCAAAIALTLSLGHKTETRTMVAGIISVIFNIVMYAMPLDVMRLVITTQSVEYMPFLVILANWFNGIVWVVYATTLDKFDLFITIGNGMGIALGTVQLLVYFYFWYKTAHSNNNNGVQLAATI